MNFINKINEQVRLEKEAEEAMMAKHPVNFQHEELRRQTVIESPVMIDETPTDHEKPRVKKIRAVANTVNTAVSDTITANT